ncbi:MAG: squalene/phytoene synthase family protein [Candidatus Cloacimonetes bacterium]|nr:squalene/phytoene synthase family protein [Candidatus Cloacimonadota bacterium]
MGAAIEHVNALAPAAHELDSAYRYCSAYTRQHARHFYWAFAFMSPGRRRAIHAVYAFCQHADQAVDEAPSIEQGRQRLDTLRDKLERMDSSREPVMLALRDTLERFPIRRELLHQLLDGMEMDLTRQRYPDFAALSQYCWHVASVVGLMSIEIFGYRDPRVRQFAETLGLAMQLTNVARDVAEDAAEGRIYLPQDERLHHGVSDEDVIHGNFHSGFRTLMQEFCDRSDRLYDDAFALLPESERSSMKPALIMARLYRRLLVEIRARDHDVTRGKVRYPLWRKLWIALGTALSWK